MLRHYQNDDIPAACSIDSVDLESEQELEEREQLVVDTGFGRLAFVVEAFVGVYRKIGEVEIEVEQGLAVAVAVVVVVAVDVGCNSLQLMERQQQELQVEEHG